MIDFSAPLEGMNAAAGMVDTAAMHIAASPAAALAASPAAAVASDGLTGDLVSLSAGELEFAANVKAERVQADIAQTLIDIMG